MFGLIYSLSRKCLTVGSDWLAGAWGEVDQYQCRDAVRMAQYKVVTHAYTTNTRQWESGMQPGDEWGHEGKDEGDWHAINCTPPVVG